MRDLSPGLAAHLAGRAATLCRCWRLTRRDGVVAGFTDHDRDLIFDGVVHAAASGLTPSDVESQLGLAVSGGEISGALTGAALTEADIVAGRYDDAAVATFLVNWADVSQRLLLETASIGEIRRSEGHFVAETRGPAHRYDEAQGRLFQAACSADLGDSRCRIALPAHTVAGPIAAGAARGRFVVPALAASPEGWADGGRLVLTGGVGAGLSRMIRRHGAGGVVELWEPLPEAPAAGQGCAVSAGCDKSFSTCKAKFANGDNFRGFPDIPTPDFILAYARPGEGGYDGGRLDP